MPSRLSPIKVLQARAEARLLLLEAGELDLETAVEPLFIYAIENGVSILAAREIIHGVFGELLVAVEIPT